MFYEKVCCITRRFVVLREGLLYYEKEGNYTSVIYLICSKTIEFIALQNFREVTL